MKEISSRTRLLITLVVTLLLFGAMSLTSFAADKTASYNNKYGQIVPTDSKLESPKTSFTFYGDKATLYFVRISTGKSDANYAVEIYSDKACTELIRSMSGEYGSKGNSPLAISWNFKNTPGGTYYGKCYTYISRDDGNVIDSDSVQVFKIKIDRLSKKTVTVNSVKNTDKGIKITWSTLKTATKYKVYRKAENEKSWTAIQTLGTGAYTYTDTAVKSGKTYTYTVRAFDGSYKSLYNKNGLSIMFLSTPKLSSVDGSGSNGYAKLKWNAVSGAKSYEIYRKGGSLSNSSWEKIATVKGKNTISYVDKKATKTDWCYTYTVKALNGSSKSSYDSDGIDFNYIKAPTLKSVASDTNGVYLKWSCDDSDAVKYQVYRNTSSGWTKLGTTEKQKFTDKTAKSGKSYTYTVRAVSKTNGGAYNSKGIKIKYLATPVLESFKFDSKDRAVITWSKISGAEGYRVYRKTDSDSSWVLLTTVNGGSTVSYSDSGAKKSGTVYKYTVRAVQGNNLSFYDKSGIGNMFLSEPTVKLKNIMSDTGALNVSVSWNSVKGATGYNVYKKTAEDKTFKCIAKNVEGTLYTDESVQNGASYEYTVRAVNGSAMSRYTSVKFIALTMPVLDAAVLTNDGVSLSWTAVEGADTYYIYRKSTGEKWQVIGSYSLNAFVDTSEQAMKSPFYYTVVAEAEGYRSAYDNVGIKNFTGITELTAEFVSEDDKPNITVNWTADDTAESVELFKSNGDDKVSLGVFDTSTGITIYKDEDIVIGTEYTYTAVAIKEGKVSTEKTASAKYPHAPLAQVEFTVEPVYSDEGSYITVNFIPVEFAECYEIYRRTSADDKWIKLATAKATEITGESASYKDVDVDDEIKYYYTVKAVASDRDSFYNTEGVAATVYTPLEPAAGIIVQKDVLKENIDGVETETDVAVVSWDEVKNGTYYKVLRKTADTDWEVLGLVFGDGEMKFVDKTIVQGVEYTYTVEVSAPFRGEAINELGAEFCWKLPETPDSSKTEKPEDSPEQNENINQ